MDSLVESSFIFLHGEEERNLFAGAGLVVKKLGGEVRAAFVVGGASDDFKRDAGLVGELVDDGSADSVFVGGRVADFLGGPVDVNFVFWKVEVVGDSNGEKILVAVYETLNEFLRGKALILIVGKWKTYAVIAYCIKDSEFLAYIDKIVATVQVQYRLAK